MKVFKGNIKEVVSEKTEVRQNANLASFHIYNTKKVENNVRLVKLSKHRYVLPDYINNRVDLVLRRFYILTDGVLKDKPNGLGLYVDKDSLKEVEKVTFSKRNK